MTQDFRSIPLEVLRDFVRTQSEITSIRACAAEVGLGRTTLHLFIQGQRNPHPRVRRALGLWYLRKQNEAVDIDVVRPYVSALSILIAGLPEMDRDTASALVLETLEAVYTSHAEIPRWLELLLTEGKR